MVTLDGVDAVGYRTIVNNFTSGELDPKFLAMVSYDKYHKGCRQFKNAVCIPQGGSTRRFGSGYEDIMVDRTNGNAPLTNPDEVRVIGYEYDQSEKYFIVIRPDSFLDGGQPVNIAFDVYIGGVLVETTYPAANVITTAQIRDIRWTERSDRILLFHNDIQIHQVIRKAMATWEAKAVTLIRFPTYDYTDLDDPAVPYTAAGETYTPTGTTGSITFARSAGTSTPFTDNHVGGIVAGNSGIGRITAIASATSATVTMIEDFANTSAILGEELLIAEKAWGNGSSVVVAGAARGWPAHGTFFQSRLVVANWKYKPSRGTASQVDAAYDFDDSEELANFGYSFVCGKAGNDVVNDIFSYKSLIAIGYKSPSATSILLDTPTTPVNIYMNTQGTEGGCRIDAKAINNQVLFIDKNFRTVWSMYYDVPDSGYTVSNISSKSAHLITEARWTDVYDPIDKDGRYFLLVNEDGTIASYQTIVEEDIQSWSECYTVGSYTDVASAGEETRVIVKRQINTGATIAGIIDAAFTGNSTFSAFVNVQAEFEAATNVSVFVLEGDYLLIGNEIQFIAIDIEMSTLSSADCALTFEYLHENGDWTVFTPTDNTAGFTLDGTITWGFSDVSNWYAQELENVKRKFWIRIKRTEETVATTPIVDLFRINTANRLYLEALDFNKYMDSEINLTASGAGLITGLTHLAGQRAYVYANDFPVGDFMVSSAGEIQLDATLANASVTVGLEFKPYIIPMPLSALLQNGYNTYKPQHVSEAFIDYYESIGITANGQQVCPAGQGAFLGVDTPQVQTGFYEIPVHKGWDPRQEIVISQSYPAPMTLLGIGLTVEIS